MYNTAHMKKYVSTTFILFVFYFLMSAFWSIASADTSNDACVVSPTAAVSSTPTPTPTQWPKPQLTIDKFIRDPRVKDNAYVNNLSYNDYRFSPGEDIIFKIVIRNTGSVPVHNVKITDTIPQVTNMLILSGEVREGMREITKDWGTVGPNEVREWYFRVRVKPASEIKDDVECEDPNAINRAKVTGDAMPVQEDTSSFCVKKSVAAASTQPETGVHLIYVVGALGSIATIAASVKKFV